MTSGVSRNDSRREWQAGSHGMTVDESGKRGLTE
jgi:hypothetical protein